MRSALTLARLASLLLLACGLAAPAAAAERWDAFVLPQNYTDLLAVGDTVWCGTLESGMLGYHRSSGDFLSFTKKPSGIASNKVTALALDRGRRLWVGTGDGGVSRLDRDRKTWGLLNQLDGLPSTAITALRAQGDTLWIGTDAGLAFWNGEEIGGRVPDGVNQSPFSNNRIEGIVPIGDSTLWVATSTGIYVSRFSSQLSVWDTASTGIPRLQSIRFLVWDGIALMTVYEATPFIFNFATRGWSIRGGIGPVKRLSDHRGVILATTENGIFRWDPVGFAWIQVNASLVAPPSSAPTSPGAYAATVDESGSYAAANQTGLYLGSQEVQPWTRAVPPGPPANDILNLELDGDFVYVNTDGYGAGRFDGHGWRLWLPGSVCAADTCPRPPAFPFGLLRDRQGRKWMGTWNQALEEFDDFADPPVFIHHWDGIPFPNKHTWVWGAAADSAGGRWFAMDTPCLVPAPPLTPEQCEPLGIEYYDSRGIWRKSYTTTYSPDIPNNKAHSLTVDRDGKVWAGFSPGGIVRFDPPSDTLTYNIRVLPVGKVPTGYSVEGLVAHGDYVWALTDNGLLRIDRLNLDDTLQYVYTGSIEFKAIHPLDVGPDGSVWVGTDAGVRLFPAPATPLDFVDFNTTTSPLVSNAVRAVRVDQRTGVVWIGTTQGLSRYDRNYVPPPAAPPTLGVKVFPNPAMITAGGVPLRLGKRLDSDPGGIYRGAVYDVNGRRMRSFQVDLEGPSAQVFWDGRDGSGNLVRAGIYFVRVEAGGRACTVRVALVR